MVDSLNEIHRPVDRMRRDLLSDSDHVFVTALTSFELPNAPLSPPAHHTHHTTQGILVHRERNRRVLHPRERGASLHSPNSVPTAPAARRLLAIVATGTGGPTHLSSLRLHSSI